MPPEPVTLAQPACPAPPLRLRLDAEALAGNWRVLDRLSGAAAAGAAVKADGYGTGARRASEVLWTAGAREFFVAHWAEAAELVDVVPPAAISVLHGPLTGADAQWARATGVRPVINSLAQAQRWIDAGGGPCHLMVDTGMNRLGVAPSALGEEVVRKLDVDILLSHLAAAEDDTPLNELQRARWQQARGVVAHNRASLANSAGIMLGHAYHGDVTRPGLALYGGLPCAALAPHIRQTAFPEVAVIQVRDIAAGEPVGYNATFVAPAPMRIAVLSLGYADGYLRCWSDCGGVLFGGQRLKTVGRVSMDMTIIDVTRAPEITEGDWLTIDYALPDAAQASGLSQYELLTLLGSRFSR